MYCLSHYGLTEVTYRSVDASGEVEEGEKGNGSSDDQFSQEEQEIGHLVQNGNPNLEQINPLYSKMFLLTMFLKIRPKACFADLQKLLPWAAVRM